MASIRLKNVTKTYGKVAAIKKINLEIRDKEFFVLFGPAGAGKTTLLKLISGIEYADSGVIEIGGKDATVMDPSARDVAMVFENYALYPHMNLFDNIASPLRSSMHRTDEKQIAERVHSVAKVLGIDNLLERLPSQVSNGQKQRTALGRCLIRQPQAFLMDEPLAHLDAKLQHSMRIELKEMQYSMNTTTLYVTHNYAEAMSLGDRIAIINHGEIEQIGTGAELYFTPTNTFVARLIGEPEINLLEATIEGGELSVLSQPQRFKLPADVRSALGGRERATLGIRAGNLRYSFEPLSENSMKGRIYSIEPIGNKSILIIELAGEWLRTLAPNNFNVPLDTPVYIEPDVDNAIFFDSESGRLIVRHDSERLLKR